MYLTLCGLWLTIGLMSSRVPIMPIGVWVALCGFPAGAALSVAHHMTLTALRWYVAGVIVAGGTRTIAYLIAGTIGAIPAIWTLVVVQACFGYYLVTDRMRT